LQNLGLKTEVYLDDATQKTVQFREQDSRGAKRYIRGGIKLPKESIPAEENIDEITKPMKI
jgi:hypothetical protein